MFVELVNEIVHSKAIAISFCPQTLRAMCWEKVVEGDTLDLLASGLLYRENQVACDNRAASLFSQMLKLGYDGKNRNSELINLPLIELEWSIIISYFLYAKVFKHPFSVQKSDEQLKAELIENERYYGIIQDREVYMFSYDHLGDEVSTLHVNVFGQSITIVGSKSLKFITSYKSQSALTAIQNEFPVVMSDENGTKWDVFGNAVSGPDAGAKLESVNAYMASGWAWRDLFESVYVY